MIIGYCKPLEVIAEDGRVKQTKIMRVQLKDSPEDYFVLIKRCIYILLMQTMCDE